MGTHGVAQMYLYPLHFFDFYSINTFFIRWNILRFAVLIIPCFNSNRYRVINRDICDMRNIIDFRLRPVFFLEGLGTGNGGPVMNTGTGKLRVKG